MTTHTEDILDMLNYFHIIRKRMITLGIKPSHARAMAIDFDQQVKARGITHALEYFKSVGDTLVGYHSNGYKAPWVKTSNGYPSRWILLQQYSVEVQLRVAKMARVILLKNPTPSMVRKLMVAAISPYSGVDGAVEEMSRLVSLGMSLYADLRIPKFIEKLDSVLRSSRTYTSRSVPTGTSVGLDMDQILSCFATNQDILVSIPNWYEAFYPIHSSWIGRNAVPLSDTNYVGQIGGAMEQGGKLRMFAAPNALLNIYLEPLQKWIDKIREQIPSDVFKDQSSGAVWAQDKMVLGHEVQSIDLSSATCRFPFEPQLEVLEKLGASTPHLNLYKFMARGRWKVQPKMVQYFGSEFSWMVGQPLGTNPSMSSFALTHNFLLAGICKELELDHTDSFRVLGDDVITCNRELSTRYRTVITNCGIDISEHKSYSSKLYGEFAGYSITPNVLVRPGRWRAPSVLNIQGLVSDLGSRVISELPEDQRFIEELLSFSTGDFNPEPHEWASWIKLLTLVQTVNQTEISLKNKETPWYDGCCSWLSKQFRNIYFEPEDSSLFMDLFPDSQMKSMVNDLLYPFFTHVSAGRQALVYEAACKDCLDFTDLVHHIKLLSEKYEGYLWSLPKTSGRLARDKRKEIASAVYALGM